MEFTQEQIGIVFIFTLIFFLLVAPRPKVDVRITTREKDEPDFLNHADRIAFDQQKKKGFDC